MKAQRQGGFSLIETLVSVFVIGIAILGSVRLQAATSITDRHSAFQSAAAHLSASIADSLLASARSEESMVYLEALLASDSGVAGAAAEDGKSDKPQDIDCYRHSCSPAQLARADLHAWQERMRAELPGGTMRICRDAHPWDEQTKTYRWDCSAAGQPGAAPIVVKIGWRPKPDEAGTAGRRLDGNNFPPAWVMPVGPWPAALHAQ